MSGIQRPLDHEAVQSADEQIYAAHEDDPRPNALFDEDGNRKQLSSTDPSQEALRQEWREYYSAAVDAKKAGTAANDDDQSASPSESDDAPPPSVAPGSADCDPGNPVLPCQKTHQITIQVKPFQNPEKRPEFWPAPPPESAYGFEFYTAEITTGHAEDYLNGGATAMYSQIPAGDCQIKLPFAFNHLRDYFDAVIRGGDL